MTYRDDLAAAQARADALQRRVVELEAENAALVHVRDRAVGRPRPDVPKRRFVRNAAVGALTAGAGFALASALVADPLVRVILMIAGVGCLPLAMSFLILATRWIKAGPDEAMIVSGGKRGPRVIAPGHGSFVAPFVEEAHLLDLRPVEVTARVGDVDLRATARIRHSERDILLAAQHFLGNEDRIPPEVARILESAARDALGRRPELDRAEELTIELAANALDQRGLEVEGLKLARGT